MVTKQVPVPAIENDSKRYYKFEIIKNENKGGAWLATILVSNREGKTVEFSAEAFSSLAPAKRWSAEFVGRSRLPWNEIVEKKAYSATHEVKVKA